ASPTDLIQAGRLAVALGTAVGVSEGQRNQAGGVLDAALKRQPDSVGLLQVASFFRHAPGTFDEQLALHRRLETLAPPNPWYLNNMAWTLSEDLGDPTAALPLIDRLLAKVGEVPQCLDTRGMILTRLGRPSEAIRDFAKAVTSRPDNA